MTPDDIIRALKLREGERKKREGEEPNKKPVAIPGGVSLSLSPHFSCRFRRWAVRDLFLSLSCKKKKRSFANHNQPNQLIGSSSSELLPFLKKNTTTPLWLLQSRCCFLRRRRGSGHCGHAALPSSPRSDSSSLLRPSARQKLRAEDCHRQKGIRREGRGKFAHLRPREDRQDGPSRLQVPFTGRCQSKCRGNVPPQAGEPAALIVDAQGDNTR